MAAGTQNTVLLRRPLPPLQKREDHINTKKKQAKGLIDTVSSKKQALISANNQVSRKKFSKNQEEGNEKMKEYQERISLLFSDKKPRGGDPFPFRSPKKAVEIDYNAFLDDSYEPPPPIFRLDDFLLRKGDKVESSDITEFKIQAPVIERQLMKWNVYQTLKGGTQKNDNVTCQKVFLDDNADLPEVQPRIPFRQKLIEERALEGYSAEFAAQLIKLYAPKVNASKKPSIARPTYISKDRHLYVGEDDVIYEDDSDSDSFSIAKPSSMSAVEAKTEKSAQKERPLRVSRETMAVKTSTEKENCTDEIFLVNSPPFFFQGELSARSPSPFDFQSDQTVRPVELAVLQCIRNGGNKLILKAHFIDQLPNITQLSSSLTHVNLSFNCFVTIPEALFEAPNLEILKLRNNPVCNLPDGIMRLERLRTLILSFCCISTLPQSLFHLTNLETLDLSYNEIAFVPEELKNLRSLKVLNFEGNKLTSFPRGILLLDLRMLNVANNFIHNVFWKTTSPPQPQNLIEICARVLAQQNQHLEIKTNDVKLKSFLASMTPCDFCGGPKFGQGIRVIKPAAELFGIKNLPILFHVCSQYCRGVLRRSAELSISPELP